MASWLGLTSNCSRRIHRTSTLQSDIECLCLVFEAKNQMQSSEADILRKDQRTETSTKPITIHSDCLLAISNRIQWIRCLAFIHYSSARCAWNADSIEQSNSFSEHLWNFRLHLPNVNHQETGQATDLSDIDYGPSNLLLLVESVSNLR